jgi:4-hydroxybenzoate polyprenyltransferase/phosphoserine phosphatase
VSYLRLEPTQSGAMRSATQHQSLVCVDLDGTLLASDMLWESLMLLIRTRPSKLFHLPFWLIRGKAYFKRQLARCVKPNPALLPYRRDVLSFLRDQHAAGAELILVTASDRVVANEVASHLGLFTAVLGSEGTINLSGSKKVAAIRSEFGDTPFDYVGNAPVDLPIFQAARCAIVVHPSRRLKTRVEKVSRSVTVLPSDERRFGTLLAAMRPNQWAKNLLLLVPAAMAHRLLDIGLVWLACAFVAFSFCTASVYVLNDLFDLESDRSHPTKRSRPFAAGELSIQMGFLLWPLFLGLAMGLSYLALPLSFVATLAGYWLLSTAYTMYLKRLVILDVVVLAGLYTLRLWAGSVASGVPVSQWLLAFSSFLFLSLAFLKRYSELSLIRGTGQAHSNGRGYMVADIDILRSIGASSGLLSILVLALYVNSVTALSLYGRPDFLWLLTPPLLYWVIRMWFLADRGILKDDPVVFTMKDPVSYGVGCLIAFILIVASF